MDMENTNSKNRPKFLADQAIENPAPVEGASFISEDPRLKSPDDLLNRLAPKKNNGSSSQVEALRENYEKELDKWKEYEKRIKEWKKQVLDIVQSLKRDATDKQQLVQEVKRLKQIVKMRDEELLKLRRSMDRPLPPPKGFWDRIIH